MRDIESAVHIVPWGTNDLPLLEKLLGDPEMTHHIGGPETPEKLAERQARYERTPEPGTGRQFKIVHSVTGEGVGWVGYWERTWRDEPIYEIGWSVLVAFQGKGIGSSATAQALARAKSEGKHRFAHAFPSVANPASNGIGRTLGFTFVEEVRFEHPPGTFSRCNEWRYDLFADQS
ncbi:MAG: GNAT family N-acetyltransferase [Actinomycetota bacterium]